MSLRRPIVWTLTLLLLSGGRPAAIRAEERAPSGGGTADAAPAGVVSADSGDTLSRLLEVPAIRQAHDECKAPQPNGSILDAAGLENCINEKIKNDENTMELARAIVEQRTNRENISSTDETKGARFERNVLSNAQQNTIDPALEAIQRHLAEKLREAMYGEMKSQAENKKVRVVDHGTFTSMFESRVSKNVIEAISSFCLDLNGHASSETIWLIERDTAAREARRKANIERITAGGAAGATPGATPPPTGGGGESNRVNNAAKADFEACAGHMKTACTHRKETVAGSDPASPTFQCPFAFTPATTAGSDLTAEPAGRQRAPKCSDDEFTQQRACEVQRVLEHSRQQMLYIAAVKEGYEKLGMSLDGNGTNNQTGDMSNAVSHCTRSKNGVCQASEAVEVHVYTGAASNRDKTIEEVTTVTSGEIASAYDEASKANVEALDECKANPDPTNPACARVLMTEDAAKAAKDAVAETGLRMRMMESSLTKIKDQINEGNEEGKTALKRLLKEEGRTDEQIAELVDNGDDERLKRAIADIESNYKAQRDSLVSSLSKKINDHSLASGVANPEEAARQIDRIKAELASKPNEYKQVLHFSNIISAMLGGDSSNGGLGGSSGAAARELANQAEANDSLGIKSADQTRDALTRSGVAVEEGGSDQSRLGDGTLTNLLEHDGFRRAREGNGTTGTNGAPAGGGGDN